jgi:hypothetical protein
MPPARLAGLLQGDQNYPRDLAVTVDAEGRIVIVGKGLSPSAPLCCPDMEIRKVFTWSNGSFAVTEASTGPVIGPS